METRAFNLATLLLVLILPLALGPGTTPRAIVDGTWASQSAVGAPASGGGRVPLSFVPNAGQADPEVRFQVHTMGGTAFFTPDGVVLSLPGPAEGPTDRLAPPRASSGPASPPTVVRVRFPGASPTPQIEGRGRLPGVVSYLMGNDPARWRANLPTYAAVVYRDLYPGVDLRYDGGAGGLKGTYVVAPGADPGIIQLAFSGVDRLEIDEQGDLLLGVPGGEIRQEAPYVYQERDGVEDPVAARYALGGESAVGFQIASYDATRPLFVDPSIGYATYLGGSSGDAGTAIAVDAAYNIFLTGTTASTDFPTEDPAQGTLAGSSDVFVAKLDPQGAGIVYATFLGGLDSDRSHRIAVDEAGSAYVVGTTESWDFPTTPGAFDRSFAGGAFPEDAFVVKLNPEGSGLEYATYLGGSRPEEGHGIAVDDEGNAYVTGPTQSEDFPTQNPFQSALANDFGYADAFVTKINATGSALVYSTYLGGDYGANGYDIAVDDSGQAYVTGGTSSTDFPTQSPYQGTHGGGTDAFVTKFNSAGTALVYSTYLGGHHNDYGLSIDLDITNRAHVGGMTSSAGFPTRRAFQPTFAGVWDGFVTQLDQAGSHLGYSTFLGGSSDEQINDIALDPFGNVFVTGQTRSTDFPTAMPDQAANAGEYDVLFAKLRSTGWGLTYATYLGGGGSDYGLGIATDGAGGAHVTGSTYSSDFPTTAGALDASYQDGEGFVARASNVVGVLRGPIAPAGGALSSSEDGVSFTFGSGAFAETVSLTCRFLEADQASAALAGLGRIYELSAISADGVQVADLAPGATYAVSIAYEGSGPAIEETLALYYWDGVQWVKEPTSTVDVGGDTVTATPNHLSLWAVLGETRRVFLPALLRN